MVNRPMQRGHPVNLHSMNVGATLQQRTDSVKFGLLRSIRERRVACDCRWHKKQHRQQPQTD